MTRRPFALPLLALLLLLLLACPAGADGPPPQRDWFKAWADAAMWLDVATCFPPAGRALSGTVEVQPDGGDALWKEAQAAGGSDGPAMPCLGVEAYREGAPSSGEEPRWRGDFLPIKQGRVPFTIPAGALPPGEYDLRVLVVSPDGARWERPAQRLSVFGNTYRQPPHLPLTVRPAGTPVPWVPAAPPLPDSKPLLTRAVRLGSPNRERFPKDDNGDCYARSVHILRPFDGRLFIGCGDWGANRGPIDLWAYVPATGKFEREGAVDDESIDVIRPLRGELYVPGIDAKEDFSFGNVYLRLPGAATWVKRRSLPSAVHVLDVTLSGDTLYAGGGHADGGAGLWASTDDGVSWSRVTGGTRMPDERSELGHAFRFYGVSAVREGVLCFDQYAKTGPWLFKDGRLARVRVPLFADFEADRGASFAAEPFGGGLLYRARVRGASAEGQERNQLFYLNDLATGGRPVAKFKDGGCGPFCVDNGAVLALTGVRAAEGKPGFSCTVWASLDLKAWRRVAAFTLPGVPSALARLNGRLYVGIGYDGTTNPEAGALYRLE
jgi:hypothetical protein